MIWPIVIAVNSPCGMRRPFQLRHIALLRRADGIRHRMQRGDAILMRM